MVQLMGRKSWQFEAKIFQVTEGLSISIIHQFGHFQYLFFYYNFQNFCLMQSLNDFTRVIRLFQTQIGEQTALNQADKEFLLKPLKLRKISLRKMVENYAQTLKKYEQSILEVLKDDWHKNQGKIFIQFLICFCKLYKEWPDTMTESQWTYLSELFFNKNPIFLKFQGLSIMRHKKKNTWGVEEDNLIRQKVRLYGQKNWNEISKSIFYQTGCIRYFSPKQIRERWFNHISQNVKRGDWAREQDLTILEHVLNNNRHWCQIVKKLHHTRTQHMVKNRYKYLVKPSKYKKPPKQERILRQVISRIRRKIGYPSLFQVSRNSTKKNQIPVTQNGIYKSQTQQGEEINLNMPSGSRASIEASEMKQADECQSINTLGQGNEYTNNFITFLFPAASQNENNEEWNYNGLIRNTYVSTPPTYKYYNQILFTPFYFLMPNNEVNQHSQNQMQHRE